MFLLRRQYCDHESTPLRRGYVARGRASDPASQGEGLRDHPQEARGALPHEAPRTVVGKGGVPSRVGTFLLGGTGLDHRRPDWLLSCRAPRIVRDDFHMRTVVRLACLSRREAGRRVLRSE